MFLIETITFPLCTHFPAPWTTPMELSHQRWGWTFQSEWALTRNTSASRLTRFGNSQCSASLDIALTRSSLTPNVPLLYSVQLDEYTLPPPPLSLSLLSLSPCLTCSLSASSLYHFEPISRLLSSCLSRPLTACWSPSLHLSISYRYVCLSIERSIHWPSIQSINQSTSRCLTVYLSVNL